MPWRARPALGLGPPLAVYRQVAARRRHGGQAQCGAAAGNRGVHGA